MLTDIDYITYDSESKADKVFLTAEDAIERAAQINGKAYRRDHFGSSYDEKTLVYDSRRATSALIESCPVCDGAPFSVSACELQYARGVIECERCGLLLSEPEPESKLESSELIDCPRGCGWKAAQNVTSFDVYEGGEHVDTLTSVTIRCPYCGYESDSVS